jgi:hypothetical protein
MVWPQAAYTWSGSTHVEEVRGLDILIWLGADGGVLEPRSREVHATRLHADQVGAHEICLLELGPDEARPLELSDAKVRLLELGLPWTAEARFLEPGAFL